MANPVAILGTTSSHGGSMITASATKFQTSGGAACRLGDSHSCPIPSHGVTAIVSAVAVHAVQGQPLAMQGSVAGCGAVLSGNFAVDAVVT